MRVARFRSFDERLRIFPERRDAVPYLVLAVLLVAVPFALPPFYVKEIAFVLILAVAGLSLTLLTGMTGLVSLGHGALIGLGAYLHAWLLRQGLPVPLSLVVAALATGVVATLVSLPALRLHGMYLAIATLAISLLLEQAFAQWTAFTGGSQGIAVPRATLLGGAMNQPVPLYLTSLACAALGFAAVRNLMRTRTGRALAALRDSAVAARSMGIDETRYKALAFFASAVLAGLSGGLLAHYMGFISPETFGFLLSVKLLILVVVGGIGSLHGAAIGAVFVGLLPQVTSLVKDTFPEGIASQPSLETVMFGLILVAVVLWEPAGLYGRWLKIRHFLEVFPTHRANTFVRQKTFARTERLR